MMCTDGQTRNRYPLDTRMFPCFSGSPLGAEAAYA